MSCGNCQRLVDFIDRPAHPPAGVDPKKLHPIFLKHPPAYSVLCTCGHYTFYVDEAERAAYEARHPQTTTATIGPPDDDRSA